MTLTPLLRMAWQDLRGSLSHGFSGFRVLLAGLTLGVAAVAASGTVIDSIQAGLHHNARVLLGGDVSIRRLYRPATSDEHLKLSQLGTTSDIATVRVMVRRIDGTGRALLSELKAVDSSYPLIGTVATSPQQPLSTLFAEDHGLHGVAVAPGLLHRLNIHIGDSIRIGRAAFIVRAEITNEPDAAGGAFSLGPRILSSFAGLKATGLVQPGSLISYSTRIRANLPDQGKDLAPLVKAQLTDQSWLISGLADSARRSQRFLETIGRFLTWAGLTALLVGGIGVASAVKSVLEARRPILAILKAQGATNRQITLIHSLVIGAVAVTGILFGLILGALAPWPVAALIGKGTLPAAPIPAIYIHSLLRAGAFGAVITALFAWWPMLRVRNIPAASLLRDFEGSQSSRIPIIAWGILIGLVAIILTLMAQTSDRPALGLGFAVGAAGVLALLRGVAFVVQNWGIPALSRRKTGILGRLAFANMARPHSPMVSMLVALGLGATVLVALTQVQNNVSAQFGSDRKANYPTYFFMDIQPHQAELFKSLLAQSPGTIIEDSAPMVRGRVISLAGRAADPSLVDPSVRWVLRGDRGFTSSATPPKNAEIVSGSWWGKGIPQTPLVSVEKGVAEGLGLHIGDQIGVNILGRDITATIANFRAVRWASLSMNFAFVFSPGVLDGAPHTRIATVHVQPDQEIMLEQTLAKALPNVSAIRVADILERAQGLADVGGRAVLAVTAVTVLAGLLVLAGAVSSGLRQRLDEAVILKVLGARRRDLLKVTAWEFLGIGAIVGGFAILAGSAVSWAVVTFALKLEWTLFPWSAITVAIACIVVGIATGGFIAARILSARPAHRLRHL